MTGSACSSAKPARLPWSACERKGLAHDPGPLNRSLHAPLLKLLHPGMIQIGQAKGLGVQ